MAYALSGEEVVFLFNESADLGRKSLEELKDVFADLNEKGCGLN